MIAAARYVQSLVLDRKWAAFCNIVTLLTINGVSATRSQRLRPAFACSDPHRFFDVANEDFSIADLAGLGHTQNRFDGALCLIVGNNHLKFYFRKKIDSVLRATINFAVPFLAAKAFYLAKTHSFHAYCQKRLFHRLGFKGLDDRLDLLHRAKLELAFQMARTASCGML
jgi:hypothetical protein